METKRLSVEDMLTQGQDVIENMFKSLELILEGVELILRDRVIDGTDLPDEYVQRITTLLGKLKMRGER